jgi:hypothetical protein
MQQNSRAFVFRVVFSSSSGSLAIFAAIRRASSRGRQSLAALPLIQIG